MSSDFSIALATYNGERYLDEQLASLEAQTRKPAELVVCDDQSSDDTIAVVERFAATASFPVHVHRNRERLGWRANFIKASGLCRHDLIAFCDQDDVWYPDKLETVASEFADPSVMLVFHNADLVDENGVAYGTLLPIATDREVIPARARPTHWSNPLGLTMVFRSSLAAYEDLWPRAIDLAVPGSPAAHDQWFYFLATNVGTVVDLPQRLLAYRQHGRNAVGWSTAARAASTEGNQRTRVREDLDRILAMLWPFCKILDEAARRGDALAPALRFAHARNLALVERLARRRALYAADGPMQRVRALSSTLVARDHFALDGWGLGGRALVEDATLGLFGRANPSASRESPADRR